MQTNKNQTTNTNTNTNQAPAPTLRNTTVQQTFITPAQVVAWAKQNKVNLPCTATQVKGMLKTVVFYNSATNAHYTGHCAVASNITVYKNFTTGLLRRWAIPTGKGKTTPAYVACLKGLHPVKARQTGYFKVTGAIAHGKYPAPKGNKPNNVIVLATNTTQHSIAMALTGIVAKMPSAHLLPPCGTWA